MPIVQSDIRFRLSTVSGSVGNSTAAGAPGTSLGGFMSTTDLSTTNLFPDVTGTQNAKQNPSYFDYQCVFIANGNVTLDALNSVLYISGQAAGGVDVTIGVDPTGKTAVGNTGAQAVQIPDRNTAPANVNFDVYGPSNPLNIGTLPHLQCFALWIRRESKNSPALNADSVTIEFDFDTVA